MAKVIFQDEKILMIKYDYHVFFINKAQAKDENQTVAGYYTSGNFTHQILKGSLYGDHINHWLKRFDLIS